MGKYFTFPNHTHRFQGDVIGRFLDAGGAEYNIKSFGAVLDGIADDTQAFVDAVGAAGAAGGGIVRHPGGDALVDAGAIVVPDYVRLLGPGLRVGTTSGKAARIIRATSGTLIDCAGANGAHKVGIEVSGIMLDGQNVAGGLTGTALDARFTSLFVSRYVEVHGNIGRAIHCAQTWDATFERSLVRRCGNGTGSVPAIDVDSTDTETTDVVHFLMPHLESNYSTSLKVSNTGTFGTPPRGVTITLIKVEGMLQGGGEEHTDPIIHVVDAEDLHILGGRIKANGDDGGCLVIGGDRAYVQANLQGDTVAPLVLLANCSRSTFHVNLLSTTAPSKVRLDSGASGNVVKATHGAAAAFVVNNSGNTSNIIIEEQDGRFRFVSGAVGLNAPEPVFANADTTPSIIGANLWGVNNSAATNITTLDNPVEGDLKVLTFFNANTTLVHSATFWLQGQRNFTPAANDVVVFYRRNNRWQELFRMQANTSPTYTVTNLTTDRSYDANATTTAELADVLGTLIADIRARAPWIVT